MEADEKTHGFMLKKLSNSAHGLADMLDLHRLCLSVDAPAQTQA